MSAEIGFFGVVAKFWKEKCLDVPNVGGTNEHQGVQTSSRVGFAEPSGGVYFILFYFEKFWKEKCLDVPNVGGPPPTPSPHFFKIDFSLFFFCCF